jgi:hypothetical protein
MKNNIPLVAIILISIYLITAHIFTFYFWYIWAKDHGFLSTLFIGPIVAEIKGLLFPFFI